MHDAAVDWVFDIEAGGLVWPDPGPGRGVLKDALNDCVSSLSPAGGSPGLSTYWIDRALERLGLQEREGVIAGGNAYLLAWADDVVQVWFDFDYYDDDANEILDTITADELVEGLLAYRHAVVNAIESGHRLDDRWWAPQNPA
jgi:hypothetical protein